MAETWIIYKANQMDAVGWEERCLMPGGSLTEILWENWDSSGILPKVGERIREYRQNEENGQITHGREGDWMIKQIHQFSSFDTDQRIVVCYCQFQPIAENWETLQRGQLVDEIISTPVQTER